MAESREELHKRVIDLVIESPEFKKAMGLLRDMGEALLKGPFSEPVADEIIISIDRGSLEVEVRSHGDIISMKSFV